MIKIPKLFTRYVNNNLPVSISYTKRCLFGQYIRRCISSLDGIEKKKTYLEQWLGNDMQGERYLEIVERNILNKSRKKADPRERNNRYCKVDHLIPSLTLDWHEPIDKIISNISASGRLNGTGFLDFKSAPESLTSGTLTNILISLNAGGFHSIAGINVSPALKVVLQLSDLPIVDLNPSNKILTGETRSPTSPLSSKLDMENSVAAAAVTLPIAAILSPTAPSAVDVSANAAMVHIGAVRSGQHIYAQGRPLVVLGHVHRGGEVLSDGDVHVYGRLMGRAVAGVRGEDKASVYATHFDPSLVGVGNAFLLPGDCDALTGLLGKALCVARADEEQSIREGCLIVRGSQAGEGERFLVSVLS